MDDSSPTVRSLLCLELLQDRPGITAAQLGRELGVTDRAARRYVAVLREAGIPVESTSGRYGGYRIGRGLSRRPLIFTATEALGLVMAVLEGGHAADDATDPVQTALGKIIRGLPESVARPAERMRAVSARRHEHPSTSPSAELTAALVEASALGRRVRLDYESRPGRVSVMEVDPWAVVVRFGRWYLLGWSHSRDGKRLLRVDRVRAVSLLDDAFEPPADLDPVEAVDDHLSQAWDHPVEVVFDAPLDVVRRRCPRRLGRLDAVDEVTTRLTGSTENPAWYAASLSEIELPMRIVGPPELREAAREAARRLLDAAG